MMTLQLTADEVLTTTRAVRRRLDLNKAVDPALIHECVEIAMQAPTGSNSQNWHFIAVFDAGKRAALAELYRRGWAKYKQSPGSVFDAQQQQGSREDRRQMLRVARSADYLAEQLERVPVHLIACIVGRPEKMGGHNVALASFYGSIFPATWSFMLAARNRGLGSCMTTVHLIYEREAAELLEIPYDDIAQVALLPVAWSIGSDFRRARRRPLDDVLHVDHW